MAGIDLDEIQKDVQKRVEDGVYVTVGLAVLAFQQAQVRRRELGKRLSDLIDGSA